SPHRIQTHFLELTLVELADRDCALIVDRLDDAACFEPADDVFGLRDVTVGTDVAVAAPVPLTEELAEVVEDRLAFVNFDAAQDMGPVADKGIRAVVDRLVR